MTYDEYKEALHKSQMSAVTTYLKSCAANTVEELTDEQVYAFFETNLYDKISRINYINAKRCVELGYLKSDDMKVSLRRAMKEGVSFACIFLEKESAEGPSDFKGGWCMSP